MMSLAPVEYTDPFARHKGLHAFSHKANILRISRSDSQEALDDIARHELSHFYLHASTPYGLLLDALNATEVSLVSNFCARYLHQTAGRITYPIYPFARALRRGEREDASASKLIELFIEPWSHALFFERVMEGEDLPSVRNANHAQAWSALARAEAVRQQPQLKELGLDGHSLAGYAESFAAASREITLPPCPTIIIGNRSEIHFGARHLFEGVAQLAESKSWDSLLDSPRSNDYIVPWLRTAMEYGVDKIRTQSDFNRARSTCIALCDLALFVPLGPVYGDLFEGQSGWMELHPAHRFLAALDEVRHVGWIDDLAKDGLDFQETVCRRVGWASPKKFFHRGAALSGSRDWEERHRDACRLRLKDHAIFLASPDSTAVIDFYKRHAPITYFPTQPYAVIRSSGVTPEPALGLLFDYFLANFTWNVMLAEELSFDEMFPPATPFSQLFQNVRSARDLLALFREANLQWLVPESFERLTP